MKKNIFLSIFSTFILFIRLCESTTVLVHLYKVFPYAYRDVIRSEVLGFEFELIKLIEDRIGRKFEVMLMDMSKNRRFLEDR